MKYVIKCCYCDHTYIVNSRKEQENFECPKCAGQNGIEHVVERIQKPIIGETRKPPYDLEVFDIPENDASEKSTTKEPTSIAALLPVVCLFILGLVMSFVYSSDSDSYENRYSSNYNELQQEVEQLKEKYETEKNTYVSQSNEATEAKAILDTWINALNEKDIDSLYLCYNIPFGSIYTKEDLEEWVINGDLKDMWGSDVKITSISYDGYSAKYTDALDIMLYPSTVKNITGIDYDVTLSKGGSYNFRFVKNISGQMKLKFWPDNATEITITSAYPIIANKYNHTTIDGHSLIGDCYVSTDAYGQDFYKYNIPMIIIGEHQVQVDTVLGTLSMPLTVTMKDNWYDIDNLKVYNFYKEEIAESLQNIWNSVHDAAFHYAAPADFRMFFDERISDEELEELTKQIRMEQDLRGNYEGATVSKITIPDGYFMAVNYNTFIIPVSMDYQTANPDHASGTYCGKLTVTFTENGWKIYETYDNRFFTLAENTTINE